MNVKKTKSSKKIVLKITMSMTLERLGHGLLVNDQVGHHFLHAAHPLLELLVFLDHGLPLEGQIISLDYNVKG